VAVIINHRLGIEPARRDSNPEAGRTLDPPARLFVTFFAEPAVLSRPRAQKEWTGMMRVLLAEATADRTAIEKALGAQ
jgi:hypothetical protein